MALATLTLAALRSKARSKSGVAVTDYSNADLDADFNQAYLTLARFLAHIEENFYTEDNTKFDLVANSSLYSLPADFMAMKQLRLAYATPTGQSSYNISSEYDPTEVHLVSSDEENIPTSNPIHNITATYIRIKPKPTASVTNGGELFYIAAPSALVNTGDIPNLPLAYHELIAVYGAKEMAFKYEKWNKHDRLDKEWSSKIAELMEILADRDRNKPARFKSALEVGGAPFNRQTRREL